MERIEQITVAWEPTQESHSPLQSEAGDQLLARLEFRATPDNVQANRIASLCQRFDDQRCPLVEDQTSKMNEAKVLSELHDARAVEDLIADPAIQCIHQNVAAATRGQQRALCPQPSGTKNQVGLPQPRKQQPIEVLGRHVKYSSQSRGNRFVAAEDFWIVDVPVDGPKYVGILFRDRSRHTRKICLAPINDHLLPL